MKQYRSFGTTDGAASLEERIHRMLHEDLWNLAMLSASQNRSLDLDNQVFSLEHCVSEVVALLSPVGSARADRVRFSSSIAGNDVVCMDKRRLQILLVNLIGNFFGNSASSSLSIEVGIDRSEFFPMLSWTFRDFGHAVGEQVDTEHSRYWRLLFAESTARMELCRAIIELKGGRVHGNTMASPGGQLRFSIPYRAVAKDARDILVVDDVNVNRRLFELYARAAERPVVQACDGAQAVESATRNHFGVIFMDVQMPVMDGISATRLIRENERLSGSPRVPIVIVTACGSDEVNYQAIEAGCDLFLVKPCTRAAFLAAVERFTTPADIHIPVGSVHH